MADVSSLFFCLQNCQLIPWRFLASVLYTLNKEEEFS